mgnify:CR=1 FL=1
MKKGVLDKVVELTGEFIGKIYGEMKNNDTGVIPNNDGYILYEVGPRYENNIPQDVTLEIWEEESNNVKRYNLKFEK